MNPWQGRDRSRSIVNAPDIQKSLGHMDAQSKLNNFEPHPEEKLETLKLRARVLAKKSLKKDQNEARLEVVEFILAHEKYAIELIHILEVLRLKELTPLPGTPTFVLGIINFRGQIISIIDLKKFFELPERGVEHPKCAIILHTDEPVMSKDGTMEFGILADTIIGVNSIPESTVQRTLPTLRGIREKYLKGITRDRIVILDGGKILSDKNILCTLE